MATTIERGTAPIRAWGRCRTRPARELRGALRSRVHQDPVGPVDILDAGRADRGVASASARCSAGATAEQMSLLASGARAATRRRHPSTAARRPPRQAQLRAAGRRVPAQPVRPADRPADHRRTRRADHHLGVLDRDDQHLAVACMPKRGTCSPPRASCSPSSRWSPGWSRASLSFFIGQAHLVHPAHEHHARATRTCCAQ